MLLILKNNYFCKCPANININIDENVTFVSHSYFQVMIYNHIDLGGFMFLIVTAFNGIVGSS